MSGKQIKKSEQVPDKKTEIQASQIYRMEDVLSGKCSLYDLVQQLTKEELTALCVGTARGGEEETSTIGAASRACLELQEKRLQVLLKAEIYIILFWLTDLLVCGCHQSLQWMTVRM